MENLNGSQPKRTSFIVLTALLFAAFAFQLVYHAVRASATYDEPNHILPGIGIGAGMLASIPSIRRY